MKNLSNLKFLTALFLFFFVLFFSSSLASAETDQEKRDRLSREIDEYTQKVKELQTQAGSLSNQIAQFDAKINLTELKIEQTKEQIELLGGRIDQIQVSVEDLANAFNQRAIETYRLSRTNDTAVILFSSPDLSKAVSRYHYLQKIQEADRDLLEKLQKAQTSYKEQKGDLEELQDVLGVQVEELATEKIAKDNLLAATKNDEMKYQSLLAEAKSQLSALRRFIDSQGGASILQNQTKCDGWGCYYNQRDSQWGNIGMGNSAYSVAEYGCLITSISMVASHYGKDIKPSDIAVNTNYFVPATGYLYHSADGMPFSLSTASASNLDSYLGSGPVIAGLYSGPDHFIVILRKEGDNYIMHDPFMPDGGNRPLTDQYSVSDISSLRLVSFN